ncbi:prolipoprotein diacylglyceryl transferase [Amylibacter marinus]|uniref:Phosphatidylglycerol--prolipoprotein diacylglyceryl transferase n=1 Tax=Amylibacter marinus TaxID=1475483 RepID=A0ABQ5VRF6_9RHOB|nr:prolipoprotein diacylglyceryl transferase [Amylibacter marinus]GLQ33839.1 prolipoprotein diacylglyceryl transferase [Amylibacter marinus]
MPVLYPLLTFPNIDPVLISFDIGPLHLAIHWYAIAYILGFILAMQWIAFLLRRPHLWGDAGIPMQKPQVEDLMTWAILGTILGGRLGYVLFYNFDGFINEPLKVLRIWEGGMSFHGGFIGVVVSAYLFCRKHQINPWKLGDLVASSACFGLFLGRIANFINAELWGRATDVPWGVAFPGESAQTCGQAVGALCLRHPSQLYEAALEGVLLFLVMVFLIFWRGALQKSGQLIGVFFAGYGLARLLVEGYRQADSQFITQDNPMGYILQMGDWGLTMGQILSLPMIIVGVVLILRARR